MGFRQWFFLKQLGQLVVSLEVDNIIIVMGMELLQSSILDVKQ